jgi:hypothetical protein
MTRKQLALFPEPPPRPKRPVWPIGSVVFLRGVEARTRSAPVPFGYRPGSPLRWAVLLEGREGLWPCDELDVPPACFRSMKGSK